MKKHNMMRVASAMAVVTLLSTGLISGTLAKYVSEATGSGTAATVARWSVKVGDSENSVTNDITGNKPWTFNVFNSVKDTNEVDETDVASGKIAPGTSGHVDLYVKNDSEVTASYTVKFASTNDDKQSGKVPLKYALVNIGEGGAASPVDGTDAWKDRVSDLSGTASLPIGGSASGYRLYWKWDFGTDDSVSGNKADTDLGTAGTAPTVAVTATVTATQVD